MNKQNSSNWQLLLHIGLVIALAANIYLIMSLDDTKSVSGGFGDLEITYLNAEDCEECFPLDAFKEYFSENGITEKNVTELQYNSAKGKKLISKYEITKVPTVIVQGDIESYAFMEGLVNNLGEVRDGAFVVTEAQPPYYDLSEGKVAGQFEVIFLDDESCEECYDVKTHEQVLARLGMKPSKTTELDLTDEEAEVLIEEYAIPGLPTILLRGDLEPYKSLQDIWPSVGTVEEDGTYVLRQGITSMGTYKQLPEGVIITPSENDTEGDLE